MNRQSLGKKPVFIITDIILVNLSYLIAFYFKYGNELLNKSISGYWASIVLVTIIYQVFFSIFKLYKNLWSYAGTYEFLIVILSCFLANITFIIFNTFTGQNIEVLITFLGGIFSILLIGGLRIFIRIYAGYIKNHNYFNCIDNKEFKRVMIIGAGTAGQ